MIVAHVEYRGDGNFRAESYKSETVWGSLDVVLATVREWMASETWTDAPDVGVDYDRP